MYNNILSYFEEKDIFYKFNNIDLYFLEHIFGSPQQIFAIAVYENENLLKENWEKASNEFATSIQSQLTGTLHDLKWDMYLLLVVKSNVENIDYCKEIENNRTYFKKIILAENLEEFHRKVPIELELDNSDQVNFFSDEQYLLELKKIIPSEIADKLNLTIFRNNTIEKATEEIFLDEFIVKG